MRRCHNHAGWEKKVEIREHREMRRKVGGKECDAWRYTKETVEVSSCDIQDSQK